MRLIVLWHRHDVRSPRFVRVGLGLLASVVLCHCSSTPKGKAVIVVSVHDQKLGYFNQGHLVKSYKVSTSKFGIGDKPGSCCTPLGKHEVIAKIGHGLPPGAVLKSRHWNGEVLKPNAPGRDPIVSRILWLRGLDRSNRNAFNRYIYIHGTTEENRIGYPASYGCIRMKSKDVIDLFEKVPIGAKVVIIQKKLGRGEVEGGSPDTETPLPGAAPVPQKEAPVVAESDKTPAAAQKVHPAKLVAGRAAATSSLN